MADGMKVKLNMEEGQLLLRVSSGFSLPAELGDRKYDVAERSLSTRDVHQLYKELKYKSPLLSTKKRLCFGPSEAWRREGENGTEQWRLENQDLEVDVNLSEDARNGAYWCVLFLLHPSSQFVIGAGSQSDVVWPLAQKLRFSKKIEKDIGLDKAEHKRIDYDPIPEEEPK